VGAIEGITELEELATRGVGGAEEEVLGALNILL